MDCDNCSNYEYDEEQDEWSCVADIDEDDYARMMQASSYGGRQRVGCPFWQDNDEYAVVRHQAF